MPIYERSQSAERASQANMAKFYETNAPGIRFIHTLSGFFLQRSVNCNSVTPKYHFLAKDLTFPSRPLRAADEIYTAKSDVIHFYLADGITPRGEMADVSSRSSLQHVIKSRNGKWATLCHGMISLCRHQTITLTPFCHHDRCSNSARLREGCILQHWLSCQQLLTTASRASTMNIS
jgi:hypothetical protein